MLVLNSSQIVKETQTLIQGHVWGYNALVCTLVEQSLFNLLIFIQRFYLSATMAPQYKNCFQTKITELCLFLLLFLLIWPDLILSDLIWLDLILSDLIWPDLISPGLVSNYLDSPDLISYDWSHLSWSHINASLSTGHLISKILHKICHYGISAPSYIYPDQSF